MQPWLVVAFNPKLHTLCTWCGLQMYTMAFDLFVKSVKRMAEDTDHEIDEELKLKRQPFCPKCYWRCMTTFDAEYAVSSQYIPTKFYEEVFKPTKKEIDNNNPKEMFAKDLAVKKRAAKERALERQGKKKPRRLHGV
jgi:hypothetical protein